MSTGMTPRSLRTAREQLWNVHHNRDAATISLQHRVSGLWLTASLNIKGGVALRRKATIDDKESQHWLLIPQWAEAESDKGSKMAQGPPTSQGVEELGLEEQLLQDLWYAMTCGLQCFYLYLRIFFISI